MATIETLTEQELELLRTELSLGTSHLDSGQVVDNGDVISKTLRIVEAQAERIAELEAAVLGDQVPRIEYDRLVQQRDEMREGREEARTEAQDARETLSVVLVELKNLRKQPEQEWRLDEAIFEVEHALGCIEETRGEAAPLRITDAQKASIALAQEGVAQAMVALTNYDGERTGELARIYEALDTLDDQLTALLPSEETAPTG